jgi:GAF domain-containing protein
MAVEALLIVTHYLLDYNHLFSSILTALVIITAAPLLERFQEWLNEYIDHLFFRNFHDAEERLAQVAATLPAAPSVDAIERQLLEAPGEAFGIVSAALFRLQDDGSFALAPHANGWPASAATAFSVDDPLVLRFREIPKPVRLNALLRKNTDLPQGAASPAIIIPLAVDRSVDAFVMYGGHESGTDLSPDEISTLAHLADAAAMARDHVRSVSLRQQLEDTQRRLAAFVTPPRLAT